MGMIAGLYRFKGPAEKHSDLDALAQGVRRWGPVRHWRATEGSVGMLAGASPAGAGENPITQPFKSSRGLLIAWDGRLDNRESLRRATGIVDSCAADPELVLAAYERWGTPFAGELLGDFALALWDAAPRTLTLARDFAGTRPLFYHATADKLVWASDIRILLALPDLPAAIDDEFVAGYLSREAEPWRTPYRDIRAVPAGHRLTAIDGRIQIERCWTLDANRDIRYRTDSEYEEQLRELFRESIRARLRVRGPVCAELSGGLDSSAIVCMADQLIKAGEVPVSGMSTVSFVYDSSSPSCDEREFVDEVDRVRGGGGFRLREEDNRILSRLDFPDAFDMPTGRLVFAGFYEQLSDVMARAGTRTLLSGTGGDQVMWGEVPCPYDLADFLRQFRFAEFFKNLRAWSLDKRSPLHQLLWRAAIMPLLPRRMRTNAKPYEQVTKWLHPRFVAATNIKDRMLGPIEAEQYGFHLPSRREQFATILELVNGLSCWYWGNYPVRQPIEVSYPFLHRPLVEFAMAIPSEQKLRPGETRSLFRRAMRDILPEKIRTRKVKLGPDEALYRALAREWPQLEHFLANARICERGYVEPLVFRKMIDGLRHGCRTNSGSIIRALSLEFWLRSWEGWNNTRSCELESVSSG
jgi:asparagine synthase (glutamine-hydrolysing)